jgi:uncharacterized protein (TIGR00106 family)
MLFSVSMFPLGGGESMLKPVTEVVDEFDRAGLHFEVTGMNTVLEGEWDEVMPVIKRAEARLAREYPRVFMALTMDDHPGVTNRLRASPVEVEHELGRPVPHGAG